MRKYLTHHSAPGELIRLKKSIQFIQEIIQSYETKAFAHLGFSCALAISKAEELKDHVSPFCPGYPMFEKLIDGLKQIYEGHDVSGEVKQYLEGIRAYFDLDKYLLIPH